MPSRSSTRPPPTTRSNQRGFRPTARRTNWNGAANGWNGTRTICKCASNWAKCTQGKARLRRRKEGTDLLARLRTGGNGQEGGSHRAVQTDLRNGHRLQGRGREGGRLLLGEVTR